MEAARSDDCAAVINANACYNKFKWNAQTLTCIDGTDNAVKAKKVRSNDWSVSAMLSSGVRSASVVLVLGRSCVIGLRSRRCVERDHE